ncbi:MAG: hypothetical protein A3D28_00350 [Omnitrophica bacterium RIFCSPHIGHO2_02_FULL_63_14]|nr:MAG: hypothetical protein A3D28_00350 [Omnitrophica bacterium RIFCSPHIGHO2_02_FULL_63_14]
MKKLAAPAAVLWAAFLIVPAGLAGEDENFPYRTVTTAQGLTFRVPEDMPVETRGGIQAPIPFDEYMYGKFKQMEIRLNKIDSKLDLIQKGLDALRGKPVASKAQQGRGKTLAA